MVCRTCTIHPLDSNRISSFAQWRERSWCIFLEWVSMNNFDKRATGHWGPPKMPQQGFTQRSWSFQRCGMLFIYIFMQTQPFGVHLPFLELTATFTPENWLGDDHPYLLGYFGLFTAVFAVRLRKDNHKEHKDMCVCVCVCLYFFLYCQGVLFVANPSSPGNPRQKLVSRLCSSRFDVRTSASVIGVAFLLGKFLKLALKVLGEEVWDYLP